MDDTCHGVAGVDGGSTLHAGERVLVPVNLVQDLSSGKTVLVVFTHGSTFCLKSSSLLLDLLKLTDDRHEFRRTVGDRCELSLESCSLLGKFSAFGFQFRLLLHGNSGTGKLLLDHSGVLGVGGGVRSELTDHAPGGINLIQVRGEFRKFRFRHDVGDSLTLDDVHVRLHVVAFNANCFAVCVHNVGGIRLIIEVAVVQSETGDFPVLGNEHTAIQQFCMAAGGHQVNITGVPLRLEAPVVGVVPLGALRAAGEESGPVTAHTGTGGEQVNTVVVLPGLEVETDLVIVFGIHFVDFIADFDFRSRIVISLEHLQDVLPGPHGSADDEGVQFGVNTERVDPGAEFVVRNAGAHIGNHFQQTGSRVGFREVQEGIGIAAKREILAVKFLDDRVNTFAGGVVCEAVFFSRNNYQTGTVVELESIDRNRARTEGFCLDHIQEVAANRKGIGVLDFVRLRDGVRILIVTDHADRVGVFININVEFCIDADRSITTGGAAAETGLTAGDFRDHSQSAVCGEECRKHKERTGNERRNIIKLFHFICRLSLKRCCL